MKQYKLFPTQLRYALTAHGQPKRTTVMEVVLSLSSSTRETPDKKVLYPLSEMWPQLHLFLRKILRNKEHLPKL